MNDSNHKSAGKKPKLVRDSFTIPKAEYAAIDTLKARALKLGVDVKKSELLRAGLMLLLSLSDVRFKAAMASVPTIKTGRPATLLKVPARVAPAVVKTPVTKPAPAKAVVKKAVAKKVVAKVAPKTTAVKVSSSLASKPVAQAPAPKPTAPPPATPAVKAMVQPAKKVVVKKAAVTKA